MIRVFDRASLTFAVFMASELAYDLDILLRCGRVHENAKKKGIDTPAGWFACAADAYVKCDRLGEIANAACRYMSAQLASGVQQ